VSAVWYGTVHRHRRIDFAGRRRDPEEWREIVTGAHQRVGEAIYRYEGTIAQLLGDGVLAFFGAPIAHEDDAERAIRAALDILAAINAYAVGCAPPRAIGWQISRCASG
jgi:class 3 adenylate cyclase